MRSPLVFLSYSYSEQAIAAAFASGLRAEGINIWFDQDEIKFGQSITGVISQALDSTDFLVFFLSKNSINSKWAQAELSTLIYRRLREWSAPIALPVLLDDIEIPALLRDVKYLDLRDHDISRGVRELSDAIRRYVEKSQRP